MIDFDFHQPVYAIAIVTQDKLTLNLSWVNTCCRAPSPPKHMQQGQFASSPDLNPQPQNWGGHWEEVILD